MATTHSEPTSEPTSTPAPLAFVQSGGPNYADVQSQLFAEILQHLPADSYDVVARDAYVEREGVLSFDMFIRGPAQVLMSHGVADKRYLFISGGEGPARHRLINERKHVLVPGEWLKRRLLRHRGVELRDDQVHCVGWPRLDRLLRQQQALAATRVNAEPASRKKLLWAPTHDKNRRGEERDSTSSYPEFEQHLPALRELFDVDVSVHPRNRKSKKPTLNKLLEADIVVSDFGTMVYEAWALGKPVIFPHWLVGERIIHHLHGSAEAEIFSKRIGLHADSIDDLIGMAETATSPDANVMAFLNEYLDPRYTGSSGARIAQLLLTLAAAD